MTVLEIYNASFGSWVKIHLSYKFDLPETIRDRAKMNSAIHRIQRLRKLF